MLSYLYHLFLEIICIDKTYHLLTGKFQNRKIVFQELKELLAKLGASLDDFVLTIKKTLNTFTSSTLKRYRKLCRETVL